MKSEKKVRSKPRPEVIGWRELVSLPDLGIAGLAAKIDTGARTSALHANYQRIVVRDGIQCVEFTVPIGNRRSTEFVLAPLVGEREIKNSSGVSERRLVVHTLLCIGRHRWHIEVSLTNRERMEYDLILGRTAIRKRGILVDPGRSFVLDHTPATDEITAAMGGLPLLHGQSKGHDR
jgi:hypothetical protein